MVRVEWLRVADACSVDVLVRGGHNVVTSAPGRAAADDFLVPGVLSDVLLFEFKYRVMELEFGKESSYVNIPGSCWVLEICVKVPKYNGWICWVFDHHGVDVADHGCWVCVLCQVCAN